jgi:hypothetical protein
LPAVVIPPVFAMNVFEYITFAPAILPPEPEPVVKYVAVKFVVTKFVETLMFFTLSVAIALLNVKLEFEPNEPESLNWTSVFRPATCVVLIEPRVFEELL